MLNPRSCTCVSRHSTAADCCGCQAAYRIIPAELHGTAQHNDTHQLPPQSWIFEELPRVLRSLTFNGSLFSQHLFQLCTKVTVASEFPQCCKDKGTSYPLNFTFILPALQGEGSSSKWWLQKALGQTLWSWCYLHRDDQLWCSPLKDLGERECKSFTIVWQESISNPCHFSSHTSDSDLKWLPWEMQAIKMFWVHSTYFPETNSSHSVYGDLYATNLSKSLNMNWLQIWSWALQPEFVSLHSYKTYSPLWTPVPLFDPTIVAKKSFVGRCLSITSIDQKYLRL